MYFKVFDNLIVAAACLPLVKGQCLSYGWDFVNGGQGYFINTLDPSPFSFGTIFDGCTPSDTEGLIIPIVVDPNENEYFCSPIADSPDGAVQMSSCNNPDGPPLCKNQMISGTYYIVVEGLTFAWMRTFTITAGPQQTITATPTAIFNVTITPSTTTSTTSTSEYDITLTPVTVITTVPLTTITKTSTITPSKVTISVTSTSTKSKASATIYSNTFTTTLETLTCKTQTPLKDPTCTLSLSKASLAASSANATFTAGSRNKKLHRPRISDQMVARRNQRAEAWTRNLLVKRTADLPTTVIIETTYIASVYTTFTEPASTEIDTFYTTTTSTITPPATTSTSYSGKAKTTITVTVATPTRTVVVHTTTTVFTARTIWATITITSEIKPNSLVCSAGVMPTPI